MKSPLIEMNTENLLPFLIKEGIHWVESQREAHRPAARKLTKDEKSSLLPFLDPEVLGVARIRKVPLIDNPGFYDVLQDLNMPGLLDFGMAVGMVFKDTIVLSKRFLPGDLLPRSLLFHELVHVVQYEILGVAEFVERYIHGWVENGMNYYAIPLEVEAFKLERRYETNHGQSFSVAAEVLRSLEGQNG